MSAQAAVAPARAGFTEREYEFEPRPAFRSALVVDDNLDVAEMLATVLRCARYTVSLAHSASDALAMALSRHFDLVVSDIRLPGMSGHELVRVLRAMPEYRAIPIVAVTGLDTYDDRERSLEAGFSAHLRKPIDPSALVLAVSGVWH